MNVKSLRYGLVAAMLSLLISGAAQAACEWSDRIEMDYAECLEGGWVNQSSPWRSDTAWVRNKCSTLGTVVAKIDRQDAADWTVWLRDASRVNKSGILGNVRGIHCCSDLSDLCNKNDMINPEGCVAAFETSEAYQGTSEGHSYDHHTRNCEGASATADAANESCSLETTCTWWEERGNGIYSHSASRQITVPWEDVPNLILSINGYLSVR